MHLRERAIAGDGVVDEAVAARFATYEDDADIGYGRAITPYASQGGHVFLVSDLHLGGGARQDGSYTGTENFFAPAAFVRFLDHCDTVRGNTPATLVVNGDFVDFIRIMRVPETPEDIDRWDALLRQIGRPVPVDTLRTVTKRERRHGLKTDDYKCVWKLAAAVAGHREIFARLGAWIDAGNRLVVTKGNHDVEWYWKAVRDCLRFVLAQRLPRGGPLADRVAWVLPRVVFADHALAIDDEVYVEHGHRFDRATTVVGPPTIREGQELNLPFGSFFNRYLINHVELSYPYVDNIRPQPDVIPFFVRERFLDAIRLMAQTVAMLPDIPFRYYRYMFGRPAAMIATILIPVVLALVFAGRNIADLVGGLVGGSPSTGGPVTNLLLTEGRDLLFNLGGLLSSYVFAQLMAAWQLQGPTTLENVGREILGVARPDRVPPDDPAIGRQYRIAVFGHTHNPWQYEEDGRWFYNLGTWIPVVGIGSDQVRWDRTFTFLHLDPAATDPGAALYRWDDEGGAAGRLAPVTVIRRR